MRIGIAGAGAMARTHAAAYAEMDAADVDASVDVDVTAVCSPSGPEAMLAESDLDADTYTDVAAMCDGADLDAVDVCTPTHTHLDVVRTAVESGLDVFVEKPIAATLAEAREIATLVDDAGATCMVGHVVRYFPSYRRARDLAVGDPGVARARRLSPFPDWGSGDWFADRAKSGGVFVDLAVHDFDYLRWCWGPVERVFGRRHREPDAEHGFATLRFESGAAGYVEASWAQPDSRDLTYELELAGDDGLVEFSSADESPYREWTDESATAESPLDRGPYRRELEDFVSCLRDDADPAVGPSDGIEALRLALAAERSADRGEPVDPAEVET